MTVTLLQAVGEHPKGAVVQMEDRRAQILIRGGYAVPTPTASAPVPVLKKAKVH